VVLVCEKGARAVRAEAMAKKLGYEKAQALAGGMKGWRDAGMPVVKA
jgi:rhodanese-related sulfurtransferase